MLNYYFAIGIVADFNYKQIYFKRLPSMEIELNNY